MNAINHKVKIIKTFDRQLILILMSLFIIYISGTAGFCDIYKWTDENGVVHFSNTTIEASDLWQKEQALPEKIKPEPESDPEVLQQNHAEQKQGFELDGGIFWKVVTPSGKTNFLMGTVHSEDPRVVILPDHIYRIFENSKSFTMETILNPSSALHLTSSMLYMDGNNLRDVIGDELFEQVQQAMLSQGIPESGLLLLKPWAVMAILSMPESVTGQFLDLVLYENAVSMGKIIHELETNEEQLAVFTELSESDQIELLKNTLNQHHTMGDLNEKIIALYVKDDLNGMAQLAYGVNQSDGNQQVSETFMIRINDKRNIRMVSRMLPVLNDGGGFIAVGALHLTGSQGILKLLHEKGYALTHVPR